MIHTDGTQTIACHGAERVLDQPSDTHLLRSVAGVIAHSHPRSAARLREIADKIERTNALIARL